MQLTKIILTLVICILFFHCKTGPRKSFFISVEYSSWGYTKEYYLTQDSILLKANKNVLEEKMESFYSRALNRKESDSIYNYLTYLSYDTLKNEYVKQGIYDATDVNIKIGGEKLQSKNIHLYVSTTSVTDAIEKLVEKHVLDSSFHLKNLHIW